MSLTFDGDWSAPQPDGGPVIGYDIPEIPLEPTSLAMPMMCPASVYSTPTEGLTTNYLALTWTLIGDAAFTNEGGGVFRFVRQWTRAPDSFNNYETFAATYPGFLGLRDPPTVAGTSKVEVAFYIIGPGGDFASPDLIPFAGEDIATASDGSTAPLLGAILNNGGAGVFATDPSITEYQADVDNDRTVATAYSIQAEPTKLIQVRGPLWRAENRFVKAR